MKKIVEGFIRISLVALFIMPLFLPVIEVVAASRATTVRGLRQELATLQAERNRINAARNKTEAEINAGRRETSNAFEERERATKTIEDLEKSIKKDEAEIVRLNKEAKELVRLFELNSGNNVYFEYIADATSMTDLIIRSAVIEQLTQHNDQTMNNLRELIERNKRRQEELRQRNIELQSRINTLRVELDRLGRERSRLLDIDMDINTQIRNQQNLINWYSRFCREDQQFRDCAPLLASAGWTRPLERGAISSDFGWRIHPIHRDRRFHNGVDVWDLRGRGVIRGANVFSPANGRVAAIVHRAPCAGNQVFIHHVVNGRAFTTWFAHLLDYRVKVGDIVNVNTVIGRVGGGPSTPWDRCTTGYHLHYGKATGHYLIDYSTWSAFTARGIRPAGFPRAGFSFTSRRI